jgi:NDP-sugar pyrophosphorylase family protein
MKAMIFAAGLGTRLKPLTDSKPKALVEIGGKTFLEIVITKLINSGINEVVINVHHFAGQILEFLKEKNNFGITIHISDESEMLLDTGGGLKKAASFLSGNEPVVIHNVDVLSDTDILEVVNYHLKEKALATVVVRERKTQRYFMLDKNNQLVGWKNIQTGETKISLPEKAAETKLLTFSGIHIINPEIFHLIKSEGKFSIIDTYLDLAKHHRIIGYPDNSGFWLDIGKADQLEEAKKLYKSKLLDP